MPHINRIRVNNVRYNFGTQFYDDFMMRFSCKNTIYDLANGGGKSVLMLLLFQNLIPNCTLDDKQPVEKLFRTSDGSTTIHSLIEWRLSDVHVKDNYKYMLTGFCARKAKEKAVENGNDREEDKQEEAVNSQSIEYFNYCIFYRSFNDNDIKNLPLSKDGERITYSGLKNYLRTLEKTDMNLIVRIFERKGDYQRFIAGFGLYESEWEIIRGINKTEGHVRTYFETNYKTTRKVVEDLLIEEIIEKSFRNQYLEEENKEQLAKTLLQIKDKLIELSEKKEEISQYDRQKEILYSFTERTASIRQLYTGMEDGFRRMKKLYNTLMKCEQGFEKEKEALYEEREKLKEENHNLTRKVETAKVLLEKKALDALEAEYIESKKNYEEQKSALSELEKEIRLMEGAGDYFAYQEAKKEYDMQNLVIGNLMKDNQELLTQLKEAVAVKKLVDEEKKNERKREWLKEKARQKEEEEQLLRLEEQIRQEQRELTVYEYEKDRLNQELSALSDAMTEEKTKVSLLLPSEAVAERGKAEVRLIRLKEELQDKQQQAEAISKEEMERKLAFERSNAGLEALEKRKAVLQEKSGKLLNSAEKLGRIKEVYQEKDLRRLEKKIHQAYQKAVLHMQEERLQEGELNRTLEALSENKTMTEAEDLNKVLTYIKRYHTRLAVSGAAYIGKLEEEDRLEVIRKNPMFPYCVIVYENASQIEEDYSMWEQLKPAGFVPIINAGQFENFHEAVKNVSLLEGEAVLCMPVPAEGYRDAALAGEQERLKRKLSESREKTGRQSENETVIFEDYLFIRMILENMLEEGELEPQKALKQLEEELRREREQIDKLREEMSGYRKTKEALEQQTDSLRQDCEECEELIKVYYRLTELLEKYKECEKELERKGQRHTACERLLNDELKRLEALKNMHENRLKKIRRCEQEQEQTEKLWKDNYSLYYDDEVYRTLTMNHKGKTVSQIKREVIGEEAPEVTIRALETAIHQEHASVEDKEQLLNHEQAVMQRSLARLDYLGFSKEMFDELYEQGVLKPVTHQEMIEKRHLTEEYRKKSDQTRILMEEKKTERDKLEGQINHAISQINKNAGVFDEHLVGSEEIDTFIHENDEILKKLNQRSGILEKEIKTMEEREVVVTLLKKNCERSMEKSGFTKEPEAGMFEKTEAKELEEEYHLATAGLDRFIREKYKRTEEFDRELRMLTDTLKSVGAEKLAAELEYNVVMPDSEEAVEKLVTALKEIISLIELEKQRIEKGITDIQAIKDNFENQCIQSCVNIRTELERLSRLSQITIDDETIPMLKLKVPYVSEELYKDRMSEYIDRLVSYTDTLDNQEERLRVIRNHLCWKKMFSAIVTDMNAIRLMLYKRERISGQSRYLPYEEAVGSTGQSQGIYIQFLISVINYISSINSRETMAVGLRKVIFIDNPFGAAKDIYIWEPIFQLLKTNNVQLIVPARGATPAITGRFDVNYVLGQKMNKGKQQTVVVDYHSNVVTDELEYTTLTYEQTSLF